MLAYLELMAPDLPHRDRQASGAGIRRGPHRARCSSARVGIFENDLPRIVEGGKRATPAHDPSSSRIRRVRTRRSSRRWPPTAFGERCRRAARVQLPTAHRTEADAVDASPRYTCHVYSIINNRLQDLSKD